LRNTNLSPARQQLIQLFQDLGFGRIDQLTVRSGEPVLTECRAVRYIKFERRGEPAAPPREFELKSEHLQLLDCLDRIQDGVLERLDIRHGLPCLAEQLVVISTNREQSARV
jgi:hypothetical protein